MKNLNTLKAMAIMQSQCGEMKIGNPEPKRVEGGILTGDLITCVAQTTENPIAAIVKAYGIPEWFIVWANATHAVSKNDESAKHFVSEVFSALGNIADYDDFEIIRSKMTLDILHALKPEDKGCVELVNNVICEHEVRLQLLGIGVDLKDEFPDLVSDGFLPMIVNSSDAEVKLKTRADVIAVSSAVKSCYESGINFQASQVLGLSAQFKNDGEFVLASVLGGYDVSAKQAESFVKHASTLTDTMVTNDEFDPFEGFSSGKVTVTFNIDESDEDPLQEFYDMLTDESEPEELKGDDDLEFRAVTEKEFAKFMADIFNK